GATSTSASATVSWCGNTKKRCKRRRRSPATASAAPAGPTNCWEDRVLTTVRIFFEKRGESAYISLLDLQRVFHRLLKIGDLPVWYTQGFNPHIYLSFSCPLSLGQESLCESCEVKTEQEQIDGAVWQSALQPLMPRGIRITKVAPAQEKVGEIATAAYEITMPVQSAAAIDIYNTVSSAEVTKKTKRGQKTLDL